MNTMIIGYINGIIKHAYIKPAVGACYPVALDKATSIATDLIAKGAKHSVVELNANNSYDVIEFYGA